MAINVDAMQKKAEETSRKAAEMLAKAKVLEAQAVICKQIEAADAEHEKTVSELAAKLNQLATSGHVGRGRPLGAVAKRGPGRPKGTVKRGRGRPKGSKNKVGVAKKVGPKRGRGRPPGSKNKPKVGRPKGVSKKVGPKRGPGRPPKHRGPGRPKGAKNKIGVSKKVGPKVVGQKRGRGRPKGSKNKPKPVVAQPQTQVETQPAT